jgi:hypothetical protein
MLLVPPNQACSICAIDESISVDGNAGLHSGFSAEVFFEFAADNWSFCDILAFIEAALLGGVVVRIGSMADSPRKTPRPT